jgi:hypothetical protein
MKLVSAKFSGSASISQTDEDKGSGTAPPKPPGAPDVHEGQTATRIAPRSSNRLRKYGFWADVFHRYYYMKLFGTLLAIYTAVLAYTYKGTFGKYGGVFDRETGFIIDTESEENTRAGIIDVGGGVTRAVVAATSFEIVALVIARFTAFYMYPGTHHDV